MGLVLYGLTAESRVADPKGPSRMFSWLLWSDPQLVVEYKWEISEGLPDGNNQLPLHERNRTPENRPAKQCLKSIKYGNRISTLSPDSVDGDVHEWMFEVVFDYGEHDANEPNSRRHWQVAA